MRSWAAPAHGALLMLALLALPATVSAKPAPVRFAAFGDIGNTSNSAAVAKLTRERGVDMILMLGDLCYGSQPLAVQIDANYRVEKTAGKLRPSLGNHESSDPCGGGRDAPAYQDYFSLPGNERYYDFKLGPVHFFALNSHKDPDGVSATSEQARWLKEKLAASTAPWQVVFFHHPPQSSGKHGSTKSMRWPYEEWGVDAVLTAHDHHYERIMKDLDGNGVEVPYFVSGLGGHSRRSLRTPVVGSAKRYSGGYGALFVTATASKMEFEFISTDGVLIDSHLLERKVTKGQQRAKPRN